MRRALILSRSDTRLDTLPKAIIEAWRIDYNTLRPHASLGQQPPFARIGKPFRNTRPQLTPNGQDERQPTLIFQGRLRCAVVESGLSRRRPRVRAPSTPPTQVESAAYIVEMIARASGRDSRSSKAFASILEILERNCVFETFVDEIRCQGRRPWPLELATRLATTSSEHLPDWRCVAELP